jgi:DNA-binding transcriptional LysR family regulator
VELRQLRSFVVTAERQHFGRAAHALHLTTSSLSQQMRTLERDLQVALFDRGPHGTSLTPAGQILLVHARILLARAERTRDAVRDTQPPLPLVMVRLGTGLPAVLAPALVLLRERTGLVVDGAEAPECDAVAAVAQERADAAVVWAGADADGLERSPLGTVGLLLVVPPGHPLDRPGGCPRAILAGHRILTTPPLHRALHRAGSDVDTAYVTDPAGRPTGELRRQVLNRRGLGLVVDPGRGRAEGLTLCALTPPFRLRTEILFRDPADAIVRELAEALRHPVPPAPGGFEPVRAAAAAVHR